MQARIYRPARNAMQSGKANTRRWVLEFDPAAPKKVDPLMGWVGSADTRAQLRIKFATREDAIAYAQREGITYHLVEDRPARPVRPKTYADNFRTDKVF
jgi:hypothetical protein